MFRLLVLSVLCSISATSSSAEEVSSVEEFPFLVSIRGPLHRHRCTGVLIELDVVLTSLDCVEISDFIEYEVVAGTLTPDEDGLRREVSETQTFNEYKGLLSPFVRLAVLRLSEPFQSSNSTKVADLTRLEEVHSSNLTVVGWNMSNESKLAKTSTQKKECNVRDPYFCVDLLDDEDSSAHVLVQNGAVVGIEMEGHKSKDTHVFAKVIVEI